MKLFYREIGKGDPLIILHGLYGSSDNWVSIGKELGAYNRVIIVDQRNHGQSPHSKEHNYKALSNDLLELYADLRLEKATLLGHSMGGKVAMQFAIDHPEKVSSLIVVDIAPWSYLVGNDSSAQLGDEHQQIINGLMSIPLNNISSRIEANEILSRWVKSERIRQFLLKNLKREQNGSFTWRFNLPVLASNLNQLMGSIDPNSKNIYCITQTLFIKGELSSYIPDSRVEEIKKIFPESKVVTVKKAGHWVHAEKPIEFLSEIKKFLKH